MAGNVLIIDDEEKLRSLMKRIITLEGFNVLEAGNIKTAQKMVDREDVDVVLCDVKLPDGNGVEYAATLKEKYPSLEVILLTAYGNIPDGVQAIKNGAFDYLTKGDDNNRIIPLLNRAYEKVQLQKRIEKLESQVGKKYSFDSILGSSKAIQDAVAQAGKVAPADTTVLLLGETGTGKEVFAQAIHTNSKRAGKPFVALNCSAFSRELLESELFGYKAGAFTNANRDKKGLIEEANTGTIFLDEIGEMPVDLQAKLLRVLETGEFIKIGDTKPTKVNVRIIAATNRDLKEEAEKGHFREDLYYRLNVFSITLPPLRERKKDIPVLAEYFTGIFSARINQRKQKVSPAFIEKLQQHDWKGNIRELKNVLERAVIMAGGEELAVEHLPLELQISSSGSSTLSAFDLASVEKLHIIRVLHHTRNNKTEAARLLNIGLATLYRKIEEYGLSDHNR
ncbi:MAG TPA: sigma-54 dependent transcriptional regulator [Chitinophaga sp.]|nr:sigma-54 dependent transcriptional regulator [Chitinophaga sp.]